MDAYRIIDDGIMRTRGRPKRTGHEAIKGFFVVVVVVVASLI